MFRQQMSSPSRSLAATLLLLLLLAAVAAAAAATTVEAPAGCAACYNDIAVLQSTCYGYIQGSGAMVPPSPDCCATVQAVTNVECVCDYLSSLKNNVNLDRVYYVAGQCGVAIPWSCGD